MPYIKVDTGRLSGFGNTSAAARGRVGSIKSSFSSIGSALDWDVKACSGINRTIGQINNELSNEMASLKRMEAFFDMAVRKYRDADEAKPEAKKVHTSSVQKIVPGNFRSTTKNATLTSILKSNNIVKAGAVKVNKDDNAFVEMIKKIALEVGVVGSVTGLIDAVYKASNGQYIDAVETFGDMVKGAAKTWPDLARIIGDIRGPSRLATSKKIKKIVKSALNLDPMVKNPSTIKNTKIRWGRNYVKYEKSVIGGIGVVDIAVSGIVNIITNVHDFRNGEMDATRTFVEIASETAIDVVKDAALYTVIGAGLATAATAVAAATGVTIAVPAVVVAGVVVLVNMGLDAITKHFTGKDFTEWVSDGLIDIGIWIGQGAKKAVNVVAPVIRDACTKVVNTVKDTANKVIGNVKQGVKNFFGKLRFAF